jgi:hypothetical protein
MGIEFDLDSVRKAFAQTGPSNPLRKLSGPDKEVLYALLGTYAVMADSRKKFVVGELWEDASKIAKQSKALATRIEDYIFHGPSGQAFAQHFLGYRHLPKELSSFSNELDKKANALGKPGHKATMLSTSKLVMASEFIRRKTGDYQDEHIAELYQAICDRDSSDDFSGDAIRKKRASLRQRNPALYAYATSMNDEDLRRETNRALEVKKVTRKANRPSKG